MKLFRFSNTQGSYFLGEKKNDFLEECWWYLMFVQNMHVVMSKSLQFRMIN